MHVADMLSRAFLPLECNDGDNLGFVNMDSYLSIFDKCINKIKAETWKDQSLQNLSETILKGWLEEKKLAP